jgi:fluoride ion exporter CrcB/FEX
MKNTLSKRFYITLLTVILITFIVGVTWQISKGDVEPIVQFLFVSALTMISFGNLTSFVTYSLCHKSEYNKKDWIYIVLYSSINILFVICLCYIWIVLCIILCAII